MDKIILNFKNLLNLTYFGRIHHDCSNTATTQQEHKDVQRKFCFIINAFLAFLIKHFEKISQKDIDRKTFKITFTEALQAKIYFQNHVSRLLLALRHLLKHSVVNSLARRMEIQAPQGQNYSL